MAPLLSAVVWLNHFVPNDRSMHQLHSSIISLVDQTASFAPSVSVERVNSYLERHIHQGQLPPAISFLTENWISLCSNRHTHVSLRDFREISLKIWRLHLSEGVTHHQGRIDRKVSCHSKENDSWTHWLHLFVQIFTNLKKTTERVLLNSMEIDLLSLLVDLMMDTFSSEDKEKGNSLTPLPMVWFDHLQWLSYGSKKR
jgi:hypothetical protein